MDTPHKNFVELVEATKQDTLQSFFVGADASNVEYLLSLNTSNRPLRPHHVDWLAEMISRNEYHPTGQGITVLRGAVLGDGQHRLGGFRKVGFRPDFPLLVVTGADPRAGAAIDTGLKRSAADLMKFVFDRPEATGQTMAACRFYGLHVLNKSKLHKPTPQQLLEWYEILAPALKEVYAAPYAARIAAPVACALAESILAGNDRQRILLFTSRIASGADCADGSPELALRRFLDKAHGSLGGSDVQVIRYEKTAAALEYFLQGKPMARVIGKKTRS